MANFVRPFEKLGCRRCRNWVAEGVASEVNDFSGHEPKIKYNHFKKEI